jgi:hypothetical protein
MPSIVPSTTFWSIGSFMRVMMTADKIKRSMSDSVLIMPVVDIPTLGNPFAGILPAMCSASKIIQVAVHSKTTFRSIHQHQRKQVSSTSKVRL